MPIKHILNENGVSEIFRLIVPNGSYSGTYDVKKPDGWNQVDSIVDINEEFFNVDNFIIGDTTKLKFNEFNNPDGFNLIKNVYEESLGDGRVIFKWIAVKNGVEYDLLSENFEINFNKYKEAFNKSMRYVETEIIKSEAQNKLISREETTIDLFETKDIDENDIDPVETFQIGYKKGNSLLSNFYTYYIGQSSTWYPDPGYESGFFDFVKSSESEFGDNTNEHCGILNIGSLPPIEKGPFVKTDITLKDVNIEISNMEIRTFYFGSVGGAFPDVALYAVVRNGVNIVSEIKLEHTELSGTYGLISIENKTYSLEAPLLPGQDLTFMLKTRESIPFVAWAIKTDTSIEITTNLESPLIKSETVRLIDAINQVAKNYTSGQINVVSNILGENGVFYNTSISTGIFLRGLPEIFFKKKINTSLKSIVQDGLCKLMALGYDISNNNLIIEDIGYFFKDYKVYDLSEKAYIQNGYSIEHDDSISFNTLLFGSKKYSTNVNFDIRNFNTSSETNTPIKTKKNKFDKQTELIIDEYKIQDLIEDQSTATNENDDDLVLIDLVNTESIIDGGVFVNCIHYNENGNLSLVCVETPFDTTFIDVGTFIEISEGINTGLWEVIQIDGSRMTLDKTSGIQEGTRDTTIRYSINSLIKNRTNEGFSVIPWTVRNVDTCTNIRHNPKYQLARWFPYFGGGLSAKNNSEKLKVTNYKNNSEASMMVTDSSMSNELQGNVVVGENEDVGRLRSYRNPFFNGKIISITYLKVTFQEFIDIYNNWKFGEGGDRSKSRGYITCNTPEGIYDVYPFGDGAFSHNKEKNTLTIKGRIKGESYCLLSALYTLEYSNNPSGWNITGNFATPVILQYSTDSGENWINAGTFDKGSVIFSSDLPSPGVSFKVRVIAECDPDLISNELEYSNIPTIGYKGNVLVCIYRAQANSDYVAKIKVNNIDAHVFPGNEIVKFEINVRFRSISANAFWERTESYTFPFEGLNVGINKEFQYPFEGTEFYVGTNWSGSDEVTCKIRVYTINDVYYEFSPETFNTMWFPTYPEAIDA